MNLDPILIQQQISNLKLACPEAWEEGEDKLLTDMLEAETDVMEFLTVVEERRQDAIAMAAGIASRIAELELRQRRYENRELAMRQLAFKVMQAAEKKKLELPIATLSIRNGTSKVIITDENQIPNTLCKLTRTPNKKEIKELLVAGKPVNGCTLSNAEPTLSIYTK